MDTQGRESRSFDDTRETDGLLSGDLDSDPPRDANGSPQQRHGFASGRLQAPRGVQILIGITWFVALAILALAFTILGLEWSVSNYDGGTSEYNVRWRERMWLNIGIVAIVFSTWDFIALYYQKRLQQRWLLIVHLAANLALSIWAFNLFDYSLRSSSIVHCYNWNGDLDVAKCKALKAKVDPLDAILIGFFLVLGLSHLAVHLWRDLILYRGTDWKNIMNLKAGQFGVQFTVKWGGPDGNGATA